MPYDICGFIQTLIIRCSVYDIPSVESLCDPYLTLKGHLRSTVLMKTERLYITLYMCFIETLVLARTVFELLAQIDHKYPNCRIGLASHQIRYMYMMQ